MSHIGSKEFTEINWLPVKERVYQCINVNIFNYFHNMSPGYLSEMFTVADRSHFTRNSTLKLPFRNKTIGKQGLSYLGPIIWNNLSSYNKLSDNVNTFKHRIKETYFNDIRNKEQYIYFYY